MRLFLCGDVMLGRGIDQVMPEPCSPELHEAYVHSALDYVRLAERANGLIPAPVDSRYVWGAALAELEGRRPDARIVNLETAITRSGDYLPKGINYRISPRNARCLGAARIDCCALANNHVLDWGRAGLSDTLATLDALGIKHAGAGGNAAEARAPAIVDLGGKGRLVFHSLAVGTSGVPADWVATADAPGVNLLPDLSDATADRIVKEIARTAAARDIVMASLHWGGNWGYGIAEEQQRFARRLIDGGVSLVHGHSSHHAKAIEVHRGRLILYGCGDFVNDYEGISGREEYRGDLAVMYFPELAPESGRLVSLDMVLLQMRRFRLHRASDEDIDWFAHILDRQSRRFGTSIVRATGGNLAIAGSRLSGQE